jgi:hypothetical protein
VAQGKALSSSPRTAKKILKIKKLRAISKEYQKKGRDYF